MALYSLFKEYLIIEVYAFVTPEYSESRIVSDILKIENQLMLVYSPLHGSQNIGNIDAHKIAGPK